MRGEELALETHTPPGSRFGKQSQFDYTAGSRGSEDASIPPDARQALGCGPAARGEKKVPFSICGAGSGLDGRNGNSRLLVGLYGGAQRLAGAGFGKRWKGQGIE
jgi:hypothetical protein